MIDEISSFNTKRQHMARARLCDRPGGETRGITVDGVQEEGSLGCSTGGIMPGAPWDLGTWGMAVFLIEGLREGNMTEG